MPIITKIKTYIKEHKGWAFLIIVAVIGIGYYFYHNATANGTSVTKYVTTTVQKQTIISSISGTGQVAAANSIDITPQISGTVTQVKVVSGQSVKAGQVIATIDAANAASALRQARASLESAKANYQKVVSGATSQDLAVSQNSIDSAQANLDNATNNLDMVKQQQALAVANAHSVLLNAGIVATPSPVNLAGANPAISGTYTGTDEGQYVINLYKGSDGSMYYTVSGLESSPGAQIPNNSASISLPLGSHGLYLQFPTANYRASDSWTVNIPNTKATNYLSSYNSYQSAIKSQTQAITNAEQSITSAQLNLQQANDSFALKAAPALPADVATAQAQIDNAQASLQTAIDNYNYTIIKAPFDGQIATLNVQKGDQAGGTAVATLITHQKVATITLNEIDVANIKLGQQATLTFDAIDGLSIAGTVSQIDTIGTVTQGVVNYTVKISFDTQNDQVKPGMSVSAAIITASKTDVLAVPSSAIKTSGDQQYVLILQQADMQQADSTTAQVTSKNPPAQQAVETGISSDTLTEITSGLQEGDIVVTQTITGSTKTAASASTGSSVRIPGLTTGGGGGGNFRGPGG